MQLPGAALQMLCKTRLGIQRPLRRGPVQLRAAPLGGSRSQIITPRLQMAPAVPRRGARAALARTATLFVLVSLHDATAQTPTNSVARTQSGTVAATPPVSASPTAFPAPAAPGHAVITLGIKAGTPAVTDLFVGGRAALLEAALATTLNVTTASVSLTYAWTPVAGWVSLAAGLVPVSGRRLRPTAPPGAARGLARAADVMLLVFDATTAGERAFAGLPSAGVGSLIATDLTIVLNDPTQWAATFGPIIDAWFGWASGSRTATEVLGLYVYPDAPVAPASAASAFPLVYVAIAAGAGGAVLLLLAYLALYCSDCAVRALPCIACCSPTRVPIARARAADAECVCVLREAGGGRDGREARVPLGAADALTAVESSYSHAHVRPTPARPAGASRCCAPQRRRRTR